MSTTTVIDFASAPIEINRRRLAELPTACAGDPSHVTEVRYESPGGGLIAAPDQHPGKWRAFATVMSSARSSSAMCA